MAGNFIKDIQYVKFSLYGFIKNLRFFDPYLILFFIESGLDYFQIGILFSIREIAINVIEVPSGFAADLLGRRRVMMGSFLIYMLSFLVFYFTCGFGPYAAAMVLFAGGEAFRTGTHKSMILDYLTRNGMGDRKVHYYGGTRAWSQRGSALSALIAGVLVYYSGSYRTVFLYTLIPYVLGFFLMVSYPGYLDFSVENDEEQGKESAGAGRGEGKKAGADGKNGKTADKRRRGRHAGASEILKGIGALMKEPLSRRVFLHASFSSAAFKTVKDYIQPMIRNFAVALPLFAGLSEEKRVSVAAGVVYFVLYLLTASASTRSGAVEDKFSSREKALNVIYLVFAVVMAVVGVCVGTPVAIAGIIIFIGLYLLENIRRPMTIGFLGDIVKGKAMATGLSIESQMKTLIVAVLAPVFGLLVDNFGLSAAMAALAIFILILYPFLRIPKTEKA
ncbi:MAG: MFS transporter [Spirochaetia bacterium]